ncbi:MAG: hypothetical protein EWM72_02781 [Nitrospira sp.]|nr:MAG: hypothetical protein EWM72_02781 [Nitrospira sp.]
MKTVRFVRDREVKDANAGTKKATIYHKDDVVELPDSSADHWINRGVAVEVTEEDKTKVVKTRDSILPSPSSRGVDKK